MASWTNIPNANLAAGAPIRSVDTLALRDNSAYNKQNVEVEFLNTQIFTASGTWTKPTGTEYNATDTVVAMYFSGGGSGGCHAGGYAGYGGAGGSIAVLDFPYGTIASSLAVTVGAGGASRTGQGTPGLTGGTTIFNGYALGGGIGGFTGFSAVPAFAAAQKLSLSGNISNPNEGMATLLIGGFGRASANDPTSVNPIPNAGGGGGGGGAGVREGFTTRTTQNEAAGVCISGLAGNGGNGGSTGVAGTAPSGGGGGSSLWNANSTSGAGARGEMRIYVVRGKVPLSFFTGIL